MKRLQVLYRDDNLIAVDKPSGMIVHRGWGRDDLTVFDILRDQVVKNQVYPLHRLDRGTSGVLLFALNPMTASFLQKQVSGSDESKRYIALVRGQMKEPVTVDHPITKPGSDKRVGAVTRFNPLAHTDRWSLIEAFPQTGRPHQIRKHLKHLSHPVVGDVKYGKGPINQYFKETYGLKRIALHAQDVRLRLEDGKLLEIHAAMPPDMAEPLMSLGILKTPLPPGFSHS